MDQRLERVAIVLQRLFFIVQELNFPWGVMGTEHKCGYLTFDVMSIPIGKLRKLTTRVATTKMEQHVFWSWASCMEAVGCFSHALEKLLEGKNHFEALETY